MPLDLWLAFASASLLVLITPGPVIALLLATGVGQGRAAALRMVPGVVLGDLAAMSLSLAGVGALLMASAALLTVLKWAGAAYLLWLGVRMWRDAPRLGALDLAAATAVPTHRLSARAFLVTLLNPKSLLFFIAFMPQFVRPDLPLLPQLLTLGATFLVLSGLNAAAYALLAGGLARALGTRVRRTVHRLGGASLVAMGLLTATLRRA